MEAGLQIREEGPGTPQAESDASLEAGLQTREEGPGMPQVEPDASLEAGQQTREEGPGTVVWLITLGFGEIPLVAVNPLWFELGVADIQVQLVDPLPAAAATPQAPSASLAFQAGPFPALRECWR